MTKMNTHVQRGKTIEQRFEEKIFRTDNCWQWTSAVNFSGYGVFWVSKTIRTVFAHRLAWEVANNAKIPEGMVVMHSCDNPSCVNPSHLSVGTNADNSWDANRKGRLSHGERNGGGGKLTWQQAREIRSHEFGCSRLSKIYGVSTQTIKAIRRGRIWKESTYLAQTKAASNQLQVAFDG